jgi:hypothetical protein
MTTILLVRHGFSVANSKGIFAGHTDVELSQTGVLQAELVCDYVNQNFKVDAVYSSDLQRAFKTVEGIGFASENDILLFERSATTDNGSAIDAYYKSTYLDFGAPDAPRRSMRAFLYASPGGSDCEILFETEQKEQVHQLLAPTHTAPQLHDMRIATHRYRFLRFTLSTGATKPTEFYRLDIYTRP